MNFDDINSLGKPYADRSIPYDDYFGDMDLSDEQIAERVKYSKDTEDVILFVLAFLDIMRTYNALDAENAKMTLINHYTTVVRNYVDVDDYLTGYIEDFSGDFIRATIENYDVAWYTSDDRAMFNAENEANNVLNYKDYLTAVANGKTHKEWRTFGDERVRKTHKKLDGKSIPINSLFEVGDSLMRFPKDEKYGAKAREIINCRCTVKYS